MLVQGAVLGGRYRLVDRIATGGMGEVWAANDDVLGRAVAVKLLKHEYADSAEFIERFRAEARNTAALSHVNIASVYDYGEDGALAYLVMELVPGEPLSQVIARNHGVELPAALSILAQAADAVLQAAHTAGVVHRDVKPGNILVLDDGSVKLTDFGIARAADSVPLTEVGQVVGTAHYMSPEQASGLPATASSDVYSLGVIGFEMLAGTRPFHADSPMGLSLAHLHEAPPALPATVPPEVRAIIARALEKQPEARYESAAHLAQHARHELMQAMPPPGHSSNPQVASPDAAPDAAEARTAVVAAGATAVADGFVDQPPAEVIVAPEARARRRGRTSLVAFAVCAALTAVVLVVAARRDDGGDLGALTSPDAAAAATTTPSEVVVALSIPVTIEVNPDVYVGHTREDAIAVLLSQGFVVDEQSEPDRAPRGTVIRIEPTGPLAQGSTVTIVVSEGKEKGKKDD